MNLLKCNQSEANSQTLSRYSQGNIDNPPPSILLIFKYVVAYQKIKDTYFFAEKALGGKNHPQK